MNYENMNNNKVVLSGEIIKGPTFSHSVFGEGFSEMYLSINRLSEKCDEIPVTVSERLPFADELKEGKRVTVFGQFRSYNKFEDGKSKLMLSVFARELSFDEYDGNPNSVMLTGYICKPPIFRTTPFNREITDLLLAVNRAYNKSDYIPAIAWGRNARFAGGLNVGDRLSVNGRIQSRIYNKVLQSGLCEDRVAYEVSISKITLDGEDKLYMEISADKK